jgi:hypothetical protein
VRSIVEVEPDRRVGGCVVRNDAWNKLFVKDLPPEWALLSFQAKMIFVFLHSFPVQPDGTLALRRPGEAAHDAITRAIGVPPKNSRRPFRDAVADLARLGFLVVEIDRVRFHNWEARRTWRGGKVPTPCADVVDPQNDTVAADPSRTHRVPTADPSRTHRVSNAHPNGANLAESNGAENRNPFEPLSQAKTSQGSKGVRREVPPGGTGTGDNPAGSDGPEVVDLNTGEIIDPADFRDPTPDERERLAAGLPPSAPTPDEADEAAGLFDVEERAAF